MTGRPQSPRVPKDCQHGGRHTHGTSLAYRSDGCRCLACTAACADEYRNRARRKAYGQLEQQRYPLIGAQRRLQALTAIGWSARALAGESGLYPTLIQVIRNGRATYVHRSTHLAIVELYDRLWNQSPPMRTKDEKGAATRARQHAARQRWRPPMFWDDDLIDTPPKVRVKPVQQLAPCGTYAAYRRHVRRGQQPCGECSAAWLRYKQSRRQAIKEAA
jgi:hypothetical protein